MATHIVFAGNLTEAPVFDTSEKGTNWARMSVAHNDRYRDQDGQWVDGPPTYYRVTCFRNTAVNVDRSGFTKGDRLIVSGTLTVRGYTDKDGNPQRSHDVVADLIGPDLTYVPVTLKPEEAPSPSSDDWDAPTHH